MGAVESTIDSDDRLGQILFNRRERPFGRSWEDWTVDWWQWLLSIPKDMNPGLDATGKTVVLDSLTSDVVFLAGNFGGNSERVYQIPAGKGVLFPIINFETSYTEEPHLKSQADLKNRAKKDMDDIVRKKVVIDGTDLKNVDDFRVQSDVFKIDYIENNVFDLKPGPTMGISDGYWVFLKPLKRGEHLIHTVGACSLGKTMVDCVWRIVVQ